MKRVTIWWLRILALSVLLSAASFFGHFGWFFDLTAHFRLQYFFIQLLGVLWSLASRRTSLLLPLLLFSLLNGVEIFTIYSAPELIQNPIKGSKFTLLELNLWRVHPRPDLVIEYLVKNKSDFLVLIEMTKDWEQRLHSIKKEYPFGVTSSRKDNFGLALWSRKPLLNCQVLPFDDEARPAIKAQFTSGGRTLDLVVAHPPPPKHPRYFRLRNEYFSRLHKLSKGTNPLVLIGDLNTPSWSRHFQELMTRMKLRDSRQGFGTHATWPAIFPFLLTPLDHCLVSREILVLDRRVGPNVLSDHYPISLQLALSKE